MRVYVSGPMTGKPDHNFAAFENAAYRLRGEGNFVISPAELSALFGTEEEVEKSFNYLYGKDVVIRHFADLLRGQKLAHSIMEADLAAVRSCDAIYLLHGWEASEGAKKELAEAIAHGLKVMQEGGEE